jgi:hypothetical protein
MIVFTTGRQPMVRLPARSCRPTASCGSVRKKISTWCGEIADGVTIEQISERLFD